MVRERAEDRRVQVGVDGNHLVRGDAGPLGVAAVELASDAAHHGDHALARSEDATAILDDLAGEVTPP